MVPWKCTSKDQLIRGEVFCVRARKRACVRVFPFLYPTTCTFALAPPPALALQNQRMRVVPHPGFVPFPEPGIWTAETGLNDIALVILKVNLLEQCTGGGGGFGWLRGAVGRGPGNLGCFENSRDHLHQLRNGTRMEQL